MLLLPLVPPKDLTAAEVLSQAQRTGSARSHASSAAGSRSPLLKRGASSRRRARRASGRR